MGLLEKRKEAGVSLTERKSSESGPPAYTVTPSTDAPALQLPALDVRGDAGPADKTTVTSAQCIVHLKFLATLADLREEIGANDGLFGLYDSQADKFPETSEQARARIREKRWAVYTAKAVDRFQVWWEKSLPTTGPLPTLATLEAPEYDTVTMPASQLSWSPNNLPPLGEYNSAMKAGEVSGAALTSFPSRRHDGLACIHAESQSVPGRLYPIRADESMACRLPLGCRQYLHRQRNSRLRSH